MPNTGTLTGLTATTEYVLDAVHLDDWGNVSAVVSSAPFTTMAAPSFFANDGFNRSNEQADTSPDWTWLTGSSAADCTSIENGRLTYSRTSPGQHNLIYNPAVPADLSAQITVTARANTSIGLLLHDTSTDFNGRSRYEIGITGDTSLRIAKRTSGFSVLAENTAWIEPDDSYTLRAESTGGSLKLYIDDVEMLSATDGSPLAGGKAGLEFFAPASPADATVDNFVVEDLT